jgi:hypothetical protein
LLSFQGTVLSRGWKNSLLNRALSNLVLILLTGTLLAQLPSQAIEKNIYSMFIQAHDGGEHACRPPLTVYTVSVPSSGAAPDARASVALDMLRKYPKVRLAELKQP